MPTLSKRQRAGKRRVEKETGPEILAMDDEDDYVIIGEDDDDDSEVLLEARAITAGDLVWDERGYQKYGCASGHGFGKTQFYKNRREQSALEVDSEYCHKITDFFIKMETTTDAILELYDNDDCSFECSGKLSIEQAIEALRKVGEPSRNQREESRREESHWETIQALAVLRYLQTIKENGPGDKMRASQMVAELIYSKTSYFSHKSRSIRRWADNMEEAIAPCLAEGEKEAVLVTHDESTFYCNEGKRLFWMENKNFRDLERDLPRTVEEHLPLRFVRRAARRVLRYAEGYRLNKIGPDLESYVRKTYKAHRKPTTLMQNSTDT